MSTSKPAAGERTDWAQMFSPPPPQALPNHSAKVAADRPAPVRAVPDLAPEAAGTAPVQSAPTPQTSLVSRLRRSERRMVATVLDTLAGEVAGVSLSGVARKAGVLVLELTLASSDEVLKLGPLCPGLALDLDVQAVRLRPGASAEQVCLEIVTGNPGAGRQLTLYMPIEVRDAANRARALTGESLSAYAMGAFNRQYEHLAQLFPSVADSPGPMPFTGRPRARRLMSSSVQVWIYLNPAQREVLDETVETFDAGSRSALFTKIFAADLGVDLHGLVAEG